MKRFKQLLRLRQVLAVVFSVYAHAAAAATPIPERISEMTKNLGKAEKIYVTPGLVTLIEFPKGITEVRVGNPQAVRALISTVSPRELTIYFTQSAVPPTNLIVRAEKRIFVFDIIPSHTSHQDFVKVRGARSPFHVGEITIAGGTIATTNLKSDYVAHARVGQRSSR